MISFDTSLLVNYYQSKLTGLGGAGTSGGGTASGSTKYAPTAPWSAAAEPIDSSQLLREALQGKKFIDEGAATLMKGVVPRVMFLAPLAALTLSLYEAFGKQLVAARLQVPVEQLI